MRLEIKVRAIGDAHQFVPLPFLFFAFGEEAVVNVHRALGVVRQFLFRLLVQTQILRAMPRLVNQLKQ